MKHIDDVLTDIAGEINRQNTKWGSNRENPSSLWMAILMEEVGELARAVLEKDLVNAEEEAVQVAAVAAQIVNAIKDSKFNR